MLHTHLVLMEVPIFQMADQGKMLHTHLVLMEVPIFYSGWPMKNVAHTSSTYGSSNIPKWLTYEKCCTHISYLWKFQYAKVADLWKMLHTHLVLMEVPIFQSVWPMKNVAHTSSTYVSSNIPNGWPRKNVAHTSSTYGSSNIPKWLTYEKCCTHI